MFVFLLFFSNKIRFLISDDSDFCFVLLPSRDFNVSTISFLTDDVLY